MTSPESRPIQPPAKESLGTISTTTYSIEAYSQTFNGESHRFIHFVLNPKTKEEKSTTFNFIVPKEFEKTIENLNTMLHTFGENVTAQTLFECISLYGTPSQQITFIS